MCMGGKYQEGLKEIVFYTSKRENENEKREKVKIFFYWHSFT
jgi:hypothetical protein